MKVMMVGTAENSGGGITSVLKLIRKMPVWDLYSCYWLETQTQGNIVKKIGYALKAYLIATLKMKSYDIVHFHMVPGINLVIQLPVFFIAKLYRKNVIAEVHVGNQLIPYSKSYLLRWWFKNVDLILFLANKWVNLFHEIYADIKTPVNVLYNACEFIEPIPIYEKKKEIIFVGTIDDNKAPDLLIKAWAKLSTKFPEWKIKILGRGNIQKFQTLSNQLGISDSIEFMGQVTGELKETIFHNASIYCMCSYMEGFPMVVLEAWAHSISVVTTPVGGLPDVIVDGRNCMVFPFGDSDKLAEQLDILIRDNQLRSSISEYGYKSALDLFSVQKINNDIDNIYKTFEK